MKKAILSILIAALSTSCLADGWGWRYISFDENHLRFLFSGKFVETEEAKLLRSKYSGYSFDWDADYAPTDMKTFDYMLKNGWKNRLKDSRNMEQWEVVSTLLWQGMLDEEFVQELSNLNISMESLLEAEKYIDPKYSDLFKVFYYGREYADKKLYSGCPLTRKGSFEYSAGYCIPGYFVLDPEEITMLKEALTGVLNNSEFQGKYKDEMYSYCWEIETLRSDLRLAEENEFSLFFVGGN